MNGVGGVFPSGLLESGLIFAIFVRFIRVNCII